VSTTNAKPTPPQGSQPEPLGSEPLDQLAELVLNADDANLPELVREAGNWLLEAFRDPDQRRKLGSTFVIKLFLDGQKALSAKPPEETDDEAEQRKSVLEQVDRLPKGHAQKLLRQEIARLDALLQQHRDKLNEL
jgi:hypothetical protein